jgi:flagellar biosynthesis/type III secretory pathway protein FliH
MGENRLNKALEQYDRQLDYILRITFGMTDIEIAEWHIAELEKEYLRGYREGFTEGYDAGYSEAVDLA